MRNAELTSQIRFNLFQQIHEICFHGQGGYDWETVYNMPIWLRKFTFNQIQQYHVKQNEEMKKAQGKGSTTTNVIDESGKVNTPEFAASSNTYKSTMKKSK